ncbi:MAG: hypothetical protein LBI10_10755 [Deltaproteobacteria bacterium]|nr:hypothetical protein [Deltaproteobacteria bacterium]
MLGLNPESREAAELACLEKTRPYYPKRNLTGQPSSVTPLDQATKKGWLLANLYPIPGTKIYSLTGFKVFAKKLGFEGRVITQAGRKIQFPGHPEQRLMALKLKGPLANAIELSKYALIESISLLKELNVKTKSLSKTQDSLENVWEQSYI